MGLFDLVAKFGDVDFASALKQMETAANEARALAADSLRLQTELLAEMRESNRINKGILECLTTK